MISYRFTAYLTKWITFAKYINEFTQESQVSQTPLYVYDS